MTQQPVLTTHQILSVICNGFNARITRVDSTCYHITTSPAQLEHLRDRINGSALEVTVLAYNNDTLGVFV